ncbi:MAG: SAM-dependent methyltransferase, partial [Hoeflea sp.]|nr:SAM-dependent methyltransferase [Hoeflea sp.]
NACLLHIPRENLPGILTKIHAALKKGGAFYASFKAGDTDGRDQFDRYYNYPSERLLRQWYMASGWADVAIAAEMGGGYDRKPTEWLHVTAIK